jgi:hypothetical protein
MKNIILWSLAFPSVIHHSLEICIAIYQTTNVFHIVAEFFFGYDGVFVLIGPKRHEFHEDISFIFLIQITVVGNIECLSNVIKFQTTIYIDFSISFLNAFLSFLV